MSLSHKFRTSGEIEVSNITVKKGEKVKLLVIYVDNRLNFLNFN